MPLSVRGLVNKQDDLNKILLDNDVDMALLCETWLNEYNTHRSRINVTGYDFIYRNQVSRKGGGV